MFDDDNRFLITQVDFEFFLKASNLIVFLLQRSCENVILIEDDKEARQIMSNRPPPRVREVRTNFGFV